jgi:predicted Fe-Mo cluster-binding NifX family protein
MKIAIAAAAPVIDTDVAAHAARAPYYLIVDANGRLLAAPANPLATEGHPAGPAAARFLAGLEVRLVVAGDFGPRFLAALDEYGIAHTQATGPVADIIARVVERGDAR